MVTVKGEAAALLKKMSKRDQAALRKRGVEGDLRVEVWFEPSDFASDGAWEQGVVCRLEGSGGKQRKFFVSFPSPGDAARLRLDHAATSSRACRSSALLPSKVDAVAIALFWTGAECVDHLAKYCPRAQKR